VPEDFHIVNDAFLDIDVARSDLLNEVTNAALQNPGKRGSY